MMLIVGLFVYALIWMASACLIAGWNYAQAQRSVPSLADRDRREDAGLAWFFGIAMGMTGPLGVLVAWFLTGFAEHGWLRPGVRP